MLQQRPYRLFFPLGVVLCAIGIGHWALHAQRWLPDYRPVFHVTAQIQGFFTCFVAGFLFTMLPRRLSAPPAALWRILVVALAPIAATAMAWQRWWVAAQLAWLIGAVVLLEFVVARLVGKAAERRGPNAFFWIPAGLATGIAGASMTVVDPYLPRLGVSWHQLGQDLVLQAMPMALIVGAGGIVVPLMTRGQGPPDGFARKDAGALLAHTGGLILLLASFWMAAAWSLRAGLLLRAAVVGGVLLVSAGLWRRPERPGWNAWLIYFCVWMLPSGLLAAAIWPLQQRAGLHISFIAGVALLALAVGAQVSFGHGGRRDVILGRPAMIPLLVTVAAAATAARIAMEMDPRRYFLWMEVSALALLVMLAIWSVWVVPVLFGSPQEPGQDAGKGSS